MSSDRTLEQGIAPLARLDMIDIGNGYESYRTLVEEKDGDWVRYEDVKNEMAFVTGYLGEHKNLLKDLGAHKQILDSVQYIIDEINKL